jgi:shikimate kinase
VADLTFNTDTCTPTEATAQLVLRLAAQWQMTELPA